MDTARIAEGQPGVDHPDFHQTLTEGVAKALNKPVEEVTPPQNQSLKVEGLGGVVGQVQSEEGWVGDAKKIVIPNFISPNTVRSAEADKFNAIQRERQEKEEALIGEPPKAA